MPKSLLCKILQKTTYDFLAHKYAWVFCFCGLIAVIVSALQFGESLIEWSELQYSISFNHFTDNIAQKSFKDRICNDIPIDVVYTWVNGSDFELWNQLQNEKNKFSEQNEKIVNCSKIECLETNYLIVQNDILSEVSKFVKKDASDISNIKDDEYALIRFENTYLALKSLSEIKGRFGYSDVQISQANFTNDREYENIYMLSDVFILSGISKSIFNKAQFLEKLPETTKQIISEFQISILSNGFGLVNASSSENSNLLQRVDWKSILGLNSVDLSPANVVLIDFKHKEHRDMLSRVVDNEELRYSLRSLEKFAPWVHHIYVVTNGQVPYWLNLANPHITVVTHKEIFQNQSHLPTFSSPAIEVHLHRIPGLSKRFLYLNDDVMFGKHVWPDDFYYHKNGFQVYLSWPVPNCSPDCPSNWIKDGYCDKSCNNSNCLWDGGDCDGKLSSREATEQNTRLTKLNMFCDPKCANAWLADKFCDKNCDVLECAYDAGDCGLENYKNLHKKDLDLSMNHYQFPLANAVYFNLTSFLKNTCLNGSSNLINGSYVHNDQIRLVSLNKQYEVMTVLMRDIKDNSTIASSIYYKCGNIIQSFHFQVSFNSSVNAEVPTFAQTTNFHHSTTIIPKTEKHFVASEYPPEMWYPRSNLFLSNISDSNISRFDNISHNLLKIPGVSKKFFSLNQSFNEGKLTMKGLKIKAMNLVLKYNNRLKKNLINKEESFSASSFKNRTKRFSTIIHSKSLKPTNEEILTRMQEIKSRIFPWEKKSTFVRNNKKSMQETFTTRKLLDVYADSLRHVNNLYNTKFGFSNRQVPGHIAHLIDKDIVLKMQETFPNEFDETSSHKFRSSNDMQFSFSYFYFMMSDIRNVSALEIFDRFDIDASGTWSNKELELFLSDLNSKRKGTLEINEFKEMLINCSRRYMSQPNVHSKKSVYVGNMSKVLASKSFMIFCNEIVYIFNETYGRENAHKYSLNGEDEITFQMLGNNKTTMIQQLESILRKPTKFICLNDNIDHLDEKTVSIKNAIKDFYEAMFPFPSQFELSSGERNSHLILEKIEEEKMKFQLMKYFYYTLVFSSIFIIYRFLKKKLYRRNQKYRTCIV